MACCTYEPYDKAFSHERARKELEDYVRTGPMASSRIFLDALEGLPLKGKSVLDIGGGIGAITFELFELGIASSTHVDISRASVDAFRSEVARRSLSERVTSVQGDFAAIGDSAEPADIVVLDKVLCCYPDARSLVEQSADKARQWYVYSIPRDLWWVRLRFFLDSLIDRIQDRYIPLYFHPLDQIDAILASSGFEQVNLYLEGKWRVGVWRRSARR
jgi:magnesium-protoporphyrin O-methyltransferase